MSNENLWRKIEIEPSEGMIILEKVWEEQRKAILEIAKWNPCYQKETLTLICGTKVYLALCVKNRELIAEGRCLSSILEFFVDSVSQPIAILEKPLYLAVSKKLDPLYIEVVSQASHYEVDVVNLPRLKF